MNNRKKRKCRRKKNSYVSSKMAKEKRNATISSITITLLTCALIATILWIITLVPYYKNMDEIVLYSATSEKEEEIVMPKMVDEVQKKPTAPPSRMAQVIAAITPAPVVIDLPPISIVEPFLDFDDGFDVGQGDGSDWGYGASFFNQKVQAQRVCYVVDYSPSMRGKKIDMLKNELAKSISQLPDKIQYQIIFFGGAAWVAGDTVTDSDYPMATVYHDGQNYRWKDRGFNSWEHDGRKQVVKWTLSNKKNRDISLKAIANTQLVSGTTWVNPLKMALKMRPKPDCIFFITDGIPGRGIDQAMRTAKEISTKARSRKIKINTISLLKPTAERALELLAKKTGGQFKLIEE